MTSDERTESNPNYKEKQSHKGNSLSLANTLIRDERTVRGLNYKQLRRSDSNMQLASSRNQIMKEHLALSERNLNRTDHTCAACNQAARPDY